MADTSVFKKNPTALSLKLRNERYQIKIFGFILLFVFSFLIAIPFFYLIVTSLKDMGQYNATNLKTVWFPKPLHPSNYIDAMTKVPIFRYMINSVLLASIQVTSSVLSSALVAFGFARFEFRGKNAVFMVVLASMMLPQQVTYIPMFIFYKTIGFNRGWLPLVIPGFFGSAFSIFLIRSFMISIPREMDDAAHMDGCGPLRRFWSVIMPQTVPALIVAGLFAFLYSWKDLLGPLIYIRDGDWYTLPVGILYFESPTDFNFVVQLAGVVLALIPTVIIYIIGHRYLEKGINISELK